MLGATHNGRNSTKAFHYRLEILALDVLYTHYPRARRIEGRRARWGLTYVGLKDVIGDGRLVDSRIFVRLEVDKRIVRDAFGGGFLCRYRILHVSKLEVTTDLSSLVDDATEMAVTWTTARVRNSR